MECSTETELVIDVGSLYEQFQILKDSRKPKGMRYSLETIMVMIVMAKISGEDTPSGIADWVKHRAEQFAEILKLKRKTMSHHGTYRRILGEVVSPQELEQVSSDYPTKKKYPGKQVLIAIDGKVVRSSPNENMDYIIAATLR